MPLELRLLWGCAAALGTDSLQGPKRPRCAKEMLGVYGCALKCKYTHVSRAVSPLVPAAHQKSLCIALGRFVGLPSFKEGLDCCQG